MKKKYYIITGLMVLALAAAGCGGTGDSGSQQVPAEISPAPSPTIEAEITPTPAGVMVEMEKVEEPDEYDEVENVIGEKTESASRVLIINQTGSTIEHIFIRAAAKDDGTNDEWGSELVHNFEWENGEEALYYYENNQIDLEGNTATSYDIRISYEDINEEELYYRNLPLPMMKELRLCMDVSGSFGIPYARYITINGNREYSTLQEVRAWYGLDVEDEETTESDEDEEDETETEEPDDDETTTTTTTSEDESTSTTESTTETTTEAATATTTEAATTTTTEAGSSSGDSSGSNSGSGTDDYDEPDYGASQASNYIGRSLDSLMNAMGSPSDSEYQDEPGLGNTGHHYYGSFTVSTIVDDDGNEIVSGVW